MGRRLRWLYRLTRSKLSCLRRSNRQERGFLSVAFACADVVAWVNTSSAPPGLVSSHPGNRSVISLFCIAGQKAA